MCTKKADYGLVNALWKWFKAVEETLLNLGWKQHPLDVCSTWCPSVVSIVSLFTQAVCHFSSFQIMHTLVQPIGASWGSF